MGMRFEWADFKNAEIWSSDELREIADDDHGLHGDVVGVSLDTGSNGVMLWGTRAQAIAFAENLLARLYAGEGKPTVDGEVVDMMLEATAANLEIELRRMLGPS